jgi:hypothetical protein
MSTNKFVWFQLVEQTGEPYKGSTCGCVSMSPESVVHLFRKAVYAENSAILPGIVSTQLLVYRNREAFDQGNSPLRASAPLNRLGETENEALVVVIPSVILSGCRVHFFNKLPEAVLKGELIAFQEDIPLTQNQKVIFIRDCYREISDIIQNDTKKSAIVSGSPGIGKSLFLIYMLWILISKNKRVLYVCLPYIIYYDEQGRVFEFAPDSLPQHIKYEFWNKDLWLLFDAKDVERIEIPGARGLIPYNNCSFVLSTSPRRAIVKDPQKIIPTLFMPVWSEKEMKVLAKMVYPLLNWKPSYVVLGGIPRLVFTDVKKDPRKKIIEACSGTSLKDCIDLVQSESVFLDKSKDPFHRLVHIFSSDNYQDQNIGFGSEAISRIIAYEKRKKDQANLYSQIASACSHGKTSSLGGYLFEFYALDLLEKGGSFKCRRLVSGNVKKRPLPFKISIPSSVREIVKKVSKSQKLNQLYVPETSN